ncbi:MAG TPA: hypothetical protein VMB50_19085 [Myxococcales bacterium]|nr:hypothetical protein [Myxococcales bacterium]
MRSLALLTFLATSLPALAAKPVDATIGQKADAKWSDTTDKAAGAADQKAQLKKGKAATVTGEVIDVSCFLQLHKRGEKHIPCGTKCIQNGQPIGIVDDAGNVYVLFAEAHNPRRDGQIDLKATFLPLLAKRVTVSGMLEQQKGTRALYVDSAALSGAAAATPAPAPAAPAAPAAH